MTDAGVRGLPVAELAVSPIEPQQLTAALAERLQPRIDRLGYLGAFFAYSAHQPDALAGFIDFTESLKHALPPDVAEVVALTVAARLRNEYELSQHERLSVRLGYPGEWVRAARDGHDQLLDIPQRSVRNLACAVLEDSGLGARPAFERAVDVLGSTAAIGILLLIGRYVAHAHIANTLELTDPTPRAS